MIDTITDIHKKDQRGRTNTQRGSITPLSVAMILSMLVCMGLFVDLTLHSALNQIQLNKLAACREATMNASWLLELKNTEQPGKELAASVCNNLRRNGFSGQIRVWFYEADAQSVPNCYRVMVWAIELSDTMPALMSAFCGICGLPLCATYIDYATPYSSETTWRPAESYNGLYTLTSKSDTASIIYEPHTDYPSEMMEVLKEQVENISSSTTSSLASLSLSPSITSPEEPFVCNFV